MNRTRKALYFGLVSLTPSVAFACPIYTVAATYPLDYLVYGALAGAWGVARLWSKSDESVPNRDAQLKRLGIWVLLSFAFGLACATEYAVDLNFFAVSGIVASMFVLSGILFRGWRTVRKTLIFLGFALALPAACGYSCTGVGPDYHYVAPEPGEVPEEVTF